MRIFLFIFFGTTILAASKQVKESLNGLQKSLKQVQKKINDLQDQLQKISVKIVVPASSEDFCKVEIACGGSHKKVFTLLPESNLACTKSVGLMNLIPSIGIYGDNYPMRQSLMSVEMGQKLLIKYAPPKLATELLNYPQAEKNFCIAIYGAIPGGDLYADNNILFHGFLGYCIAFKGKVVQRNLKMGVFGADGITQSTKSASMPFDNLEVRDVHYHGGLWSPNNAHISMIKGEKIASFWTVVLSPDEKRMAVTYNVLINDGDLEFKIKIHDGQNLSDILKDLAAIDTKLNLDKFFK